MDIKEIHTAAGVFSQISTPFLDRHNDHLQLYVKQDDDGFFTISDGGYIISDLSMYGCDILSTEKRKELLNATLSGFGVVRQGEELTVRANRENFAPKKHALIQAALAVNDMFMVSRTQVASVFLEDVMTFFDSRGISYIQNAQYVGASGLPHTFEFSIAATRNKPERFVKTINEVTRDRIQSVLFSWSDIKASRRAGAKCYVILNDTGKRIKAEQTSALTFYGLEPALWSDREKLASELVS